MDFVSVPRDLWAQVYACLELYAIKENWTGYTHKRAGLMQPLIPLVQHTSAKRVLDAIPPALFEASLLPEPGDSQPCDSDSNSAN